MRDVVESTSLFTLGNILVIFGGPSDESFSLSCLFYMIQTCQRKFNVVPNNNVVKIYKRTISGSDEVPRVSHHSACSAAIRAGVRVVVFIWKEREQLIHDFCVVDFKRRMLQTLRKYQDIALGGNILEPVSLAKNECVIRSSC